ncbi:MAG: hypothetical protein EAY66_01835 [Sphingobacteriales bacterium]|nr:MAG: hypothetical protein EAY66_01835 [Sphingobacteriales bacterium]
MILIIKIEVQEVQFFKNDSKTKENEIEITLEVVQKIVQWDMRNKRLGVNKYKFMVNLVEGKILLSDKNKYLAKLNLQAIEKYGFK